MVCVSDLVRLSSAFPLFVSLFPNLLTGQSHELYQHYFREQSVQWFVGDYIQHHLAIGQSRGHRNLVHKEMRSIKIKWCDVKRIASRTIASKDRLLH